MELENKYELYVLNDEYNTFNHVVKALINICNIDINNAYTKTLKIHHEKRCKVFENEDFNLILDIKDSLNEFGILTELIKNK